MRDVKSRKVWMKSKCNKMKLTIVYDNNAKPGFKSGWGFSCLVETDKNKKILFDTGDNADKLLFNLKKLNKDPGDIDTLVISHRHRDHTGGMSALLDNNPDVKVVMPGSFSGIGKIEDQVYTSGPLPGSVVEQSLVVKTTKGIVVIAGCAHPGIKNILQAASKFGKIYGIIGGFHGFSDYDLLEGVELIGACHCTQHIKEIKKRFPKEYKEVMAGAVIKI